VPRPFDVLGDGVLLLQNTWAYIHVITRFCIAT
jgi:hypothetical protein